MRKVIISIGEKTRNFVLFDHYVLKVAQSSKLNSEDLTPILNW